MKRRPILGSRSAAAIVSGLALLGMFGVSSSLQAATDSESITISATVGNITDIQLIDDSGTGPAATLGYIGTIRVLTNDPVGFTLTITSLQSGVLLRSGGSETIPYTMYLIEEAGALGPDVPPNLPLTQPLAIQLTSPLVSNFNSNVSPTDVTYSVNIELGSFVAHPSGTYDDVLTFDLADTL
jgi:hypothetical protein